MELKEAAKELGISTRHLHRLIRMNLIPATKITVKQIVTKQVWDIDDTAIHLANEVLKDLDEHPDHFGVWVLTWMERLGISAEKLAQMTKIKKDNLRLMMERPGFTLDEYDGLARGDPTVPIMGAIVREYIKQRGQTRFKGDEPKDIEVGEEL